MHLEEPGAVAPAGWQHANVVIPRREHGLIAPSEQAGRRRSRRALSGRLVWCPPGPICKQPRPFQAAPWRAYKRTPMVPEAAAALGADLLWTWREPLVPLLRMLGPDELEAIAAFALQEMLERDSHRLAEFKYCIHQPTGDGPTTMRARCPSGIARAGHPRGIFGLTLPAVALIVRGAAFWERSRGGAGQAPCFPQQPDCYARLMATKKCPVVSVGIAPRITRARSHGSKDLKWAGPRPGKRPACHVHVSEADGGGGRGSAWRLWRTTRPAVDLWCATRRSRIDRHWLLSPRHPCPMAGELDRIGPGPRPVVGPVPSPTEANIGDGLFGRSVVPRPRAPGSASARDSTWHFGRRPPPPTPPTPPPPPPHTNSETLEYAVVSSHRQRKVLGSRRSLVTGGRLFEKWPLREAHKGGRPDRFGALAPGSAPTFVVLKADGLAEETRCSTAGCFRPTTRPSSRYIARGVARGARNGRPNRRT